MQDKGGSEEEPGGGGWGVGGVCRLIVSRPPRTRGEWVQSCQAHSKAPFLSLSLFLPPVCVEYLTQQTATNHKLPGNKED